MSTAELRALTRAEVTALPLYSTPDAVGCRVDVSNTLNQWGAPPAALRALADISATLVARYPSLYAGPLRSAVLRYAGLEGADGVGVVTGCGSDDVLDATMRAFGTPGDRIAFSVPTFSMIPVFARLNGLEAARIPLTGAYDVDAERLVEMNAKITYLCTPNNPTATSLSRAAVEYVAAHARGIVLIDEAYAEFAADTFIDLAARHERVIVTRTFSKAFGLAGLRVGYGIGGRDAVGMVERARGPYKVNVIAERAALAALEESPDALGWVRAHAALAVENRERFIGELRARGFAPLASAANFVFVPSARALLLAQRMRECGVLVSALAGLPRDLEVLADSHGEALRIGVGPWETMQLVLDTIGSVAG